MPNRAKKHAKKPQSVKKAAPSPASSKTPAKAEDPVPAFLARLGGPKDAAKELDPAQRREVARRAARLSSIATGKTAGEREPKKR